MINSKGPLAYFSCVHSLAGVLDRLIGMSILRHTYCAIFCYPNDLEGAFNGHVLVRTFALADGKLYAWRRYR